MITQAHRQLLREAYWHIKNGTEKEITTKQKDNDRRERNDNDIFVDNLRDFGGDNILFCHDVL